MNHNNMQYFCALTTCITLSAGGKSELKEKVKIMKWTGS